MENLFAVCTPGLEPFTALELAQIGLIPTSPPVPPVVSSPGGDPGSEFGGIESQGSLHDLYRANLSLRTASRVLLRLGEFHASAFAELRRKVGQLPWERFLAPGKPVALRVTCRASRLYHERAVAERVAAAISDRLDRPQPVQTYQGDAGADLPQLILARIDHNLCTVSIDSSGPLLHRRGYRLAVTKAPLRETLAAAMVMASGWDGLSPLIDPFCGSGTIPIEAALWARGRLPGENRRFAFMDWPDFDSVYWNKLLADGRRAVLSVTSKIIASDRDAGAIRSAKANAERAGIADGIEFSCNAISAIDPPSGPGWVITNPPYGVRLGGAKDLRNLYAQFGKVLHLKCPGWHVTMLCDRTQLVRSTGLGFDEEITTLNGSLKVRLVRCQI
jgi:putative N6-adenine-specific DNA methylase